MVGLADGLTELPGIELRVYPMVELGMTEEDEVVDGDDALDATATDAYGQLARQTVIELYAIATEVANDATAAPPLLVERPRR